MSKVQRSVYEELLKPGNYIRQTWGTPRRYELNSFHRLIGGVKVPWTVDARTFDCLLRMGKIQPVKRAVHGRNQVGWAAEAEVCQ